MVRFWPEQRAVVSFANPWAFFGVDATSQKFSALQKPAKTSSAAALTEAPRAHIVVKCWLTVFDSYILWIFDNSNTLLL